MSYHQNGLRHYSPMGADIPYDPAHPCDPNTQYWDTNTGKCVPFASASSAAGGGTDWLKIGVIVGGGLLVAKMLKVF